MTVQEAIGFLKMDIELTKFDPMTGKSRCLSEDSLMVVEAEKMAIKALEKQIPKKPVKTLDGSLACECGLVLQVKNKRRCLYCCHNCGQAIDWEGEE